MNTMIRLTGLLAFAAFGLSGMPMVAHAQTYPNKSISVVVPFPAGGPSDVVARIVTEHMGRTLGQQMVVENVAGAGGTLGTARVAAARPDGYTLLAGSMGSHVAAPVLTPKKYDSERDFEPIGLTAHAPAVIVARKDFPASNLSRSQPAREKPMWFPPTSASAVRKRVAALGCSIPQAGEISGELCSLGQGGNCALVPHSEGSHDKLRFTAMGVSELAAA
jgi:Tripartite tricarboxylate transporter family receptor